MIEEEHHDPKTGELTGRPRDPISVRAAAAVQPRRHWDRLEGLVIRTGAEMEQSQYELAFLECQLIIQTVLETDAKAQISKDRSYSYATLGQVLSHVRPILHKRGFTIKQGTGRIHKQGLDGGNMLYLPVWTKFTFVGTGESETFIMEMPLPKVDPQAVGAATSYGKRYTLLGALGIATADDDAISAMSARSMSRDDEAEMVAGHTEVFKQCRNLDELQRVGRQIKQSIQGLSDDNYQKVTKAYKDRLTELQDASESQDAPPPSAKGGKAK